MNEISHPMRMPVSWRVFARRAWAVDRLSLALGVVLVLSGVFYVWTSSTTAPLSLHDGTGDRYNLLATAFLHLRVSVGPAPAALLRFANPYNPDNIARVATHLAPPTNDATSFNDDAMYHGQLYFIWGPAPAAIFLVPMHVLGFEPSASVTVFVYAIIGLGFVLATLRVLIRQIGDDVAIWMCVLAGFALSLASVVPYLLRTPNVTTDTLAGGYCFVMAGIWLATSAIARGGASVVRLALMSLCFGLALNSRPTLSLTVLVLIPVYLALRGSRSRRSLLTALGLPVFVCMLLLLVYNQARFQNPFEIGTRHQLSINETPTAPDGRLSYVLPGVGFYALTPPRFEVLFPFIHLLAPQTVAPVGMPSPELTGGLLPFAPIVVFVVALPWIWRRRPKLLGRLTAPVVVVAGIGLAIPVLPAYQFFSSTERYEADFATLLVLGGVAGWLAISHGLSGYRRRLLRVGGGLLAAWSCATGIAISFYGSSTELAVTHPAAWRTLEDVGSPISTVLAAAAGHPVVGAIQATDEGIERTGPHASLSTSITDFFLTPDEHAKITIVSPSAENAILVASVVVQGKIPYGARVDGPAHQSVSQAIPAGGGRIGFPIRLNRGLNRFTFSPIALTKERGSATAKVLYAAYLSAETSQ